MAIHLYQSKKAQRYIGEKVYEDEPWAADQVDPLTLWYVDVFFIKRERYLVITNPLTKFTFFIFRYSKKTHPDFMKAFKERLSTTMQAAEINPAPYLQQCDLIVPFRQSNKSASAHLSRIKEDYQFMIESNYFELEADKEEMFFNEHITSNITTYNKKDYDHPKRRFLHELILRRWC